MNRRKMIPYGYITYNGVALSNGQVDSYNRLQSRINSFIDGGRTVPEYLINGSFNLMQGFTS